MAALHRSGQTFITWSEREDLLGEHYRIYRDDQPITAGNLAHAVLLYEVAEGSGRFFADRYNVNGSGTWAARYVERFVIADGGEQLAVGTGLLVWTLELADLKGAASGDGYYAVTTVDPSGIENTLDFGVANTVGPIAERVDEPLPVEILTGAGGRAHIFTQFMDLRHWNPTFHAPRAGNNYYGLSPQEPGITQSIQYAYTYSVSEPDPANCWGGLPARLPIGVNLHAWGANTYGPYLRSAANYCFCEIRPIDVSETWYLGFARQHDYRRSHVVPAGDVVVNYTEQRILRMVYDVLRHPILGSRVAPHRIFVWGHSMGASGALALALRYPNVFAAAYASEPMTDFRLAGGWGYDISLKWGSSALNLPVEIAAPGRWAAHLERYNGTGVWDWQDHQAYIQEYVENEIAPLGLGGGLQDTSVAWSTQGQPTYVALNAGRRAWGGSVLNTGHTWLGFAGLPPSLDINAQGPFWGFRVALTETVPGLSDGSADLPLPPQSVGGYNQALEWSAGCRPWDGVPLDNALEWRISLRTTDGTDQTVSVTPRRLQVFRIVPEALYVWENRRVADDTFVASGVITASLQGLVTIPRISVSSSGNRVSLRLWGSPTPTLTPTQTPPLSPTPSATPRLPGPCLWLPVLWRAG